MNARSKIPFPSTILRVGPDGGGRAPTTVSVPPIKRHGLQSGLGVEYEDSESEHGDTDEETVDDTEEQSNTEEDEEMDENDNVDDNDANNDVANKDVANNDNGNSDDDEDEDSEEDTFHLTYLIKDITSIHD